MTPAQQAVITRNALAAAAKAAALLAAAERTGQNRTGWQAHTKK